MYIETIDDDTGKSSTDLLASLLMSKENGTPRAHLLSDLVPAGSIYLFKSVPFTGKAYEFYCTGIRKTLTTFLNGIKDGQHIEFYRDGTIKRYNTYVNGKIEGRSQSWDWKGRKIGNAVYENGLPVRGKAVHFMADDSKFNRPAGYTAEQYTNGKKNGYWYTWQYGQNKQREGFITRDGYYKDDKKHGTWRTWTGKRYLSRIIRYKSGKKHGRCIELMKKKCTWEEKRKYLRSWRRRIPQLRTSVKTYKSGVLNGKYIISNENGFVIEKGTLRNNRPYKKNVKYYSGKSVKNFYYDFIPSFLTIFFRKRRFVRASLENYNPEGHLHGTYKAWHRNGQLKTKGCFTDGERDGIWQFWNQEGNKIRKEYWDKGELLTTQYSGNEQEVKETLIFSVLRSIL
ncbi:MAG: hypothetical protein KJ607_02040 [Bacteroidetes bacterium]|nr:hypothetical protein [Bacteroidota bacterium]